MRDLKTTWRAVLAASVVGAAMCAPASAQEATEILGLQNRTIGFALASTRWGIHETADGKQECPKGYNMGPRDQFKVLFPEGGTVESTQLAYESHIRYPTDKPDNFPFHEVEGKVGVGLNLDGKVGANDFTSPDGEKGIDNAFYRALGCIRMFRGEASYAFFTEMWVREFNNNRILIELTDVDSLENDPDVVVSMYRGKDNLVLDVNGKKVMPGASNRVDDRFSKKYTYRLKGKIENGVLTTEPADISWAWSAWYSNPGFYDFKQGRFSLKLDPTGEGAEGLFAGYADIDTFRKTMLAGYSTHHSGYGDLSQLSMASALARNADGIPDASGKNTAVSASLRVKFAQVFILHPDAKVAATQEPGKPGRVEASQR